MSANVNNIMKKFEKRNFTTNLSNEFDSKMTIDSKTKRDFETSRNP